MLDLLGPFMDKLDEIFGDNPIEDAFPDIGFRPRIVFQSDRDGNWEIYVMDADGSNKTNLTNNPLLDIYPVWSPDGN